MEDTEKKSRLGHRERVRKQIQSYGLFSLEDHQVLEYLLFSFIPRKDTKIIAYRLIRAFGSVNAVLGANYEALLAVPDMTRSAALFLSSFPDICSFYQAKRLDGTRIVYPGQIVSYIRSVVPVGREGLFIVCLDKDNNYLAMDVISEGKRKTVNADASEIVSHALAHSAKKVILVHNHPSNHSEPSMCDLQSSLDLKNTFRSFGVELVDHIIICATYARSIFLNKEL